MPRQFGKRDQSVRWPRCRRPGCNAWHLPEWPCPPVGVWLVARNCPACKGLVYCARHSAHEFGRPALTLVRSEGAS